MPEVIAIVSEALTQLAGPPPSIVTPADLLAQAARRTAPRSLREPARSDGTRRTPNEGQFDPDPSDKQQAGALHDVAGIANTSQSYHRSYCHRCGDEEQQRDSKEQLDSRMKETAVRESGVDGLSERDPVTD
jgi:hypothetical protein